MTDRFERWINSMDDDEYADRLESEPDNGGFTENQQRIALNLREPPSDTELREMEEEQGFRPEEPKPTQPLPRDPTRGNIVFDNRDIDRVKEQPPSIRRDIIRGVTESIPKIKKEEPVTTPTPKPRPTLRQRVTTFFRRLNILQRRRVI